jgi:predicted ATP-grasp superfamily ATP-dependent carboligase
VSALKVFAFDYASGGGAAGDALPDSLRHQGQIMLRALMADLAALPGIELITISDPSLFRRRFGACLQAADAVWPLAPEAGGLLERLSRQVLRRNRILLGSKPAALRVAGSKLRTARTLARAGVAVVATYTPGRPLPAWSGAWVVKPDDGAGCLNTRIFAGADAALAWIAASGEAGYVLQPFIPGKLGSLSLLCCDGDAQLLGCNEQRIAVRDNQFHFLGTTVNSMSDSAGQFERLAQAVAAAIPGLWGHVGVDFIVAEHGVVVLEVNPRMTTSYAGLHASIGCNPAALVLDLLERPAGTPRARAKPVAVSVDVAAFGGASTCADR